MRKEREKQNKNKQKIKTNRFENKTVTILLRMYWAAPKSLFQFLHSFQNIITSIKFKLNNINILKYLTLV